MIRVSDSGRRLRKYFPALVFVSIALAGLAMAVFAYLSGQEATRLKFDATADDALNRIESRIALHLALLRANDAFFSLHGEHLPASEFKTYFDTLQVEKNFEGLQGIGMVGMAPSAQPQRLREEFLRHQGRDATIYPLNTDAEWRTPVLLYESVGGTRSDVIGFDMFSDPLRREAVLNAVDTGEPRATGLLMLGQRTGGEITPGFLIFSAIERPLSSAGESSGGSSPADATIGLLFAVFRSPDLFRMILDKFPALPAHAEVFDGQPVPENLLFKSQNAPEGDLVATRQLLVAGRPWTIVFRPTAAFVSPASQVVPVLLGLFGLLLAVAMALFQHYQARAYDAVSRMQENAEKSLSEKDMMLQEMKHRIKNSITRVLAIARQTAAGAKDMGEFSESFSARLQAMAASQDMLTRSRWQKAELGELLRIELGQAFGKELPAGLLNGPTVLLTENVTQALGLTFHELATNALKYGEVGTSADALKIEWKLDSAARRLLLTWRETGGKPVRPPEKPGFGTRLIDLNITRELKGTIRRDYRDCGLLIEIDVPLDGK